MSSNWDLCATIPRVHQKVGARWLITDVDIDRGRVFPRCYFLADEVGAGKSKQVVDASQFLYSGVFFPRADLDVQRTNTHIIDTVLTVGPAQGRGVWGDPDPALGEVARHGWKTIDNHLAEYSVRRPRIKLAANALNWIVTNYEFIRRTERLTPLLNALVNLRFWLVCDEAWALSDVHTDQWKAVNKIRQLAQRVVLLNGTPVTDTPLDLYGQAWLLHPDIIGIRSPRTGGPIFSHFRSKYAMMKPNTSFPVVTGWQNLEELRAKVEPYALRRETRDCFDLPEELEPILLEARLSDETWRLYRQMREELIAWLSDGNASIAQQAIVKTLRLAQITSGFIGGVQSLDETGFLDFNTNLVVPGGIEKPVVAVQEVGREKLDTLLGFLRGLHRQPERVLVWARFRPEIERTAAEFNPLNPADHLARRSHMLYGSQSHDDRMAAIRSLNPDIDPGERVIMTGSRAAGGAALNLSGASLEVNLSYSFLLREYLQARGRTARPGQRNRLQRVDIVATGPKGQKTVDHHVLSSLRQKQDVARWTTATWRQKLLEE